MTFPFMKSILSLKIASSSSWFADETLWYLHWKNARLCITLQRYKISLNSFIGAVFSMFVNGLIRCLLFLSLLLAISVRKLSISFLYASSIYSSFARLLSILFSKVRRMFMSNWCVRLNFILITCTLLVFCRSLRSLFFEFLSKSGLIKAALLPQICLILIICLFP